MVALQGARTDKTDEMRPSQISQDGSFETKFLRIFLIWKLKRLKLLFETETGTGQTRDGRDRLNA